MNRILNQLSISTLALIIGLLLTSQIRAQEKCACASDDDQPVAESAHSDTNIMCPVMPDVEAEDLWTTVYKGKVVRFCCNNCVESFRREPEKYVGLLPQLKGVVPKPVIAAEEKNSAQSVWLSRTALLLGVLFAGYFVLGWDQSKTLSRGKSRSHLVPLVVATILAFSIGHACKTRQTNQMLHVALLKEKAKSEIHLATYYDYGVPPVPNNPQVQPELSRSFYRGNDERSPVLYNGGNYQTAQFDIEIQYEDGTPVKVGDRLTDKPLYIQFSIQKPENAPKRMYDRKMMSRMFLTRSYAPDMGWEQPIPDKTDLQVVKEDERWSCRFELDITGVNNGRRFDPQTISKNELADVAGVGSMAAEWFVAYRDAGYPVNGPDDLRQAGITGQPANVISASLNQASHDGLVYVCEAFHYKERQLGARFHYGIQYDLKIHDGRIAEGSEIWMGALSRSLKAKKGAIPDDQWLSTKPLPQLPTAQEISDELLGIDDYEF